MTSDAELEDLRRRSFGLAYRLLGSVSEAEDIAQEALLRFHRAEREGEAIESPRAWVATVTTRLGLDELRSARVRREAYVGEWLPEPLPTDGETSDDPADRAELADTLSVAFLVLLESLSPEQRAAFLLHDVFDYPYPEIARMIDVSEDNARQLASRARRHVDERRPRFEASREQQEELADRFFDAVETGELSALEELLAGDVVLHGDGGGKAPALARPVHGRARAVRTFGAWRRAAERIGGIEFRRRTLNGQPAAMTLDSEGRVISTLTLDIADGQIQAVRGMVNPDKLRHLGPVASLGELLRGGRSIG